MRAYFWSTAFCITTARFPALIFQHVLHLVWGVLGITTAIKTAFKVALYDFFDGPLAPLNSQFIEKVNREKK